MFWEEVHYISCVGSFFFFFFYQIWTKAPFWVNIHTYGTDLKPPYNKTCQYSPKKLYFLQLLCLIEPWNRKPIESLDLWLLLKLMKTFPLMLIYTHKKKSIYKRTYMHFTVMCLHVVGLIFLPSILLIWKCSLSDLNCVTAITMPQFVHS